MKFHYIQWPNKKFLIYTERIKFTEVEVLFYGSQKVGWAGKIR